MKAKKRSAMALSFLIGIFILVTSVMAEIATKTGYDKLKDSVKLTAKKASTDYQNFTVDSNMVLKLNGEIIASEKTITKHDASNNALLTEGSTLDISGQKSNTLNYDDNHISIVYDSNKDTYFVSENLDSEINFYRNPIQNPFEDEMARDVEKIVDALLANLKDYVVVNEKENGTKEILANVKEFQIPSLINAVASFAVKGTTQSYMNYSSNKNSKNPVPVLISDIHVGEFKGRADLNQAEEIEGIFLAASLFGKDKDGYTHELVVEILFNILDVNKTIVEKPDLTGKTVEKIAYDIPTMLNDIDNYMGKYKNDIFIKDENGFKKVGERFIEMTKNEGGNVLVKHYDLYTDTQDESLGYGEFEFEANFEHGYASVNFIDGNGHELYGSIFLETSMPILYFDVHSEIDRELMENGRVFTRVFD
jgi:hypothetical protein